MIKKILILAAVHQEKDFLNQKDKLPFLYSQGQQGWVDALESIGKKVEVFRYSDSYLISNRLRIYISSFFRSNFPIFRSRILRVSNKLNLFYPEDKIKNKEFLKVINNFNPDLLIISGGLYGVDPNNLATAKKKLGFKSILISGINPNYGASGFDLKLIKNDFFDYIFTNDKGYTRNWIKLGAHRAKVIPISAANIKYHKKYKLTKEEVEKFSSVVCFIGTLSKYRQNILKKLISFDLKIWGFIPPGVKLDKRLTPFYRGATSGIQMSKIYNATKIALNIHEEDMRFGGNMKTFEIPASGAFQLIDNFDNLWFEDKKEIVRFKDIEDLISKVKFYFKNDDIRKEIADKGYRRTIKNHTYEKHFNILLKTLDEQS